MIRMVAQQDVKNAGNETILKLRLGKEAKRRRMIRAAETPEQKSERNRREAERKRKLRQEEMEVSKQDQDEFDRTQRQVLSFSSSEVLDSQEEESRKLHLEFLNRRLSFLKNKLEQRQERLRKQAEAKRIQRRNESEEKKVLRRKREAEYQRLRRASFTEEQKELMKFREAERKRKQRKKEKELSLGIISNSETTNNEYTQLDNLNHSHANGNVQTKCLKLREQFKPVEHCDEINTMLTEAINKRISNRDTRTGVTNFRHLLEIKRERFSDDEYDSEFVKIPGEFSYQTKIFKEENHFEDYDIIPFSHSQLNQPSSEVLETMEVGAVCEVEPDGVIYDHNDYVCSFENNETIEHGDLCESLILNGTSFEFGARLFVS